VKKKQEYQKTLEDNIKTDKRLTRPWSIADIEEVSLESSEQDAAIDGMCESPLNVASSKSGGHRDYHLDKEVLEQLKRPSAANKKAVLTYSKTISLETSLNRRIKLDIQEHLQVAADAKAADHLEDDPASCKAAINYRHMSASPPTDLTAHLIALRTPADMFESGAIISSLQPNNRPPSESEAFEQVSKVERLGVDGVREQILARESNMTSSEEAGDNLSSSAASIVDNQPSTPREKDFLKLQACLIDRESLPSPSQPSRSPKPLDRIDGKPMSDAFGKRGFEMSKISLLIRKLTGKEAALPGTVSSSKKSKDKTKRYPTKRNKQPVQGDNSAEKRRLRPHLRINMMAESFRPLSARAADAHQSRDKKPASIHDWQSARKLSILATHRQRSPLLQSISNLNTPVSNSRQFELRDSPLRQLSADKASTQTLVRMLGVPDNKFRQNDLKHLFRNQISPVNTLSFTKRLQSSKHKNPSLTSNRLIGQQTARDPQPQQTTSKQQRLSDQLAEVAADDEHWTADLLRVIEEYDPSTAVRGLDLTTELSSSILLQVIRAIVVSHGLDPFTVVTDH